MATVAGGDDGDANIGLLYIARLQCPRVIVMSIEV